MFSVISCITTQHDIWMVLLAAVMCVTGCAVTLSIYPKSLTTKKTERIGWQFLTAIAAGASIWATHFIAMIGHQPGAPVSYDPLITVLSLIVALAGTFIGISVSTLKGSNIFAPLGGALFGLAIAAMHYTGMFAYRITGLVEWSPATITASITLAVIFASICFTIMHHDSQQKRRFTLSLLTLTVAIVSLHFTGMTAMTITPMTINFPGADTAAMQALAVSIAGVALLILGTSIASFLIDRTLRSDSHEQLRKMALHDPLTGMPNRTSFSDRLDYELSRSKREGSKVAIICVDLNRFKEINDSRGHAAGDEMLCILSDRMQSDQLTGEYVARLGGDEFAAIKRYGELHELDDYAERLMNIFDEPFMLNGIETTAGASIGVAIYPDHATSSQQLINNADLAMFHAKANFMDQVCYYDDRIGNTVRERRLLADALQKAISDGGLSVHYQPQTYLENGRVCGYEALLRWYHPEIGNIPPTTFIPIAEENGLIIALGEWVLRQACKDAVAWPSMTKVAVNISAVQLMDPNLPQQIHQILLETGLPPKRLELELTETAVVKDKVRSLHSIRQIKSLGVNIALDDFGSGYSSLETLRTFPFDKIKLDRTFVEGVQRDNQSKAIIRAVLALGKSLNIPVLAEGIETSEQMIILRNEGCNEGQGFLLGRPAPLDQLNILQKSLSAGESTSAAATITATERLSSRPQEIMTFENLLDEEATLEEATLDEASLDEEMRQAAASAESKARPAVNPQIKKTG